MPQTLSVFKAGIGGFVGHSAMHPDVLTHAEDALARAVQAGTLIDAQARGCGDALFLILSHEQGQDAEPIHRLAWDTFSVGAEIAKRLRLFGAGQDLLTDAFTGTVRGAGPGSAELELVERPSEPVVVFLSDKTAAGAFNLPLARMFADPFTTSGLVLAEGLRAGFAFEVHDVREHRKIMLTTPEELHELLLLVGAPSRYAVKRVVSRVTGEVAAVTSTDKIAMLAGQYVGKDDPAAIVRCHGNFPAVGEVLEPFATPHLVDGFMRGSHIGPWMPVAQGQTAAGRFDGPPRVVALGYQLAQGRLVGPRDMFDDVSFDGARAEATRITDYLRRHGPFEPHRIPMDEMEYETMPAVAGKLATRWAPLQ